MITLALGIFYPPAAGDCVADDAGAMLVRAGLVSAEALETARAAAKQHGGTLGEHLVEAGAIADEALTDFYRTRLLVPQVNPNGLAKLRPKVIAAIPADMAVELRAVPVSFDAEGNLMVAMGDPSDRNAVDEIAFFTGNYVVRAVATQRQIAWCLAHYYKHVTPLGRGLMTPTETGATPPRSRGHTSEIAASRRRVLPPTEGDAAAPTGAVVGTIGAALATDGAATPPGAPRTRAISGELSAPARAVDPAAPVAAADDGDSGPEITIEPGLDRTESGPVDKVIVRRPVQKPDPPELAARGGELEVRARTDGAASEEPRVVIDLAALQPPRPMPIEASGEIKLPRAAPALIIDDEPSVKVELPGEVVGDPDDLVDEDAGGPAIIHDTLDGSESQPILLERPPRTESAVAAPPGGDLDDIVLLEPKRARARTTDRRRARRTRIGIGIAGSAGAGGGADPDEAAESDGPRSARDTAVEIVEAGPDRAARDTEVHDAAPDDLDPSPAGAELSSGADLSSGVPVPVARDEGTKPLGSQGLVPPRAPTPAPVPPSAGGGDDDVLEPAPTLPRESHRYDWDPVDDEWGPPGSTIPPPMHGGADDDADAQASPGSDEDEVSGVFPLPTASPLKVRATSEAGPATADAGALARDLQASTSRLVDLLRTLDSAEARDGVVQTLIQHLAEAHRRVGFLVQRNNMLAVFPLPTAPVSDPTATLSLDQASTFQDVAGTRLPYRGPAIDEVSRAFIQRLFGTIPTEVLLIPLTVRDRVVGILYAASRYQVTFDEHLAIATRAAGMALERILVQRTAKR